MSAGKRRRRRRTWERPADSQHGAIPAFAESIVARSTDSDSLSASRSSGSSSSVTGSSESGCLDGDPLALGHGEVLSEAVGERRRAPVTAVTIGALAGSHGSFRLASASGDGVVLWDVRLSRDGRLESTRAAVAHCEADGSSIGDANQATFSADEL